MAGISKLAKIKRGEKKMNNFSEFKIKFVISLLVIFLLGFSAGLYATSVIVADIVREAIAR